MTASYRPRAIPPTPTRLERVELGQRVRVIGGSRQGVVIHPYTTELGVRCCWVRWDSGARGAYEVHNLTADGTVVR